MIFHKIVVLAQDVGCKINSRRKVAPGLMFDQFTLPTLSRAIADVEIEASLKPLFRLCTESFQMLAAKFLKAYFTLPPDSNCTGRENILSTTLLG